MRDPIDGDARSVLALSHGIWNVVTGLWPIVSLRTFTAITGPKKEPWLVKTAGALIAGIGVALVRAGLRRRVTEEVATLAIATTAGLAAIDVWYGGVRRRISPVYLADAALELGLVAAWCLVPSQRALASPNA